MVQFFFSFFFLKGFDFLHFSLVFECFLAYQTLKWAHIRRIFIMLSRSYPLELFPAVSSGHWPLSFECLFFIVLVFLLVKLLHWYILERKLLWCLINTTFKSLVITTWCLLNSDKYNNLWYLINVTFKSLIITVVPIKLQNRNYNLIIIDTSGGIKVSLVFFRSLFVCRWGKIFFHIPYFFNIQHYGSFYFILLYCVCVPFTVFKVGFIFPPFFY